jgi:hypothetical protein
MYGSTGRKREKPVSQITGNLGGNESVLRRQTLQQRDAAADGLQPRTALSSLDGSLCSLYSGLCRTAFPHSACVVSL